MDSSIVTVAGRPPLDLSHHFSDVTKRRQPSSIKSLYKYFGIPNIKSLAGGLPNHNNFPFDTLEATSALPNRFKPTPHPLITASNDPSAALRSSGEASSTRVIVPKAIDSPTTFLANIDLKSALQYGTAQGYPPLYGFLRQFTREHMHPNVPYAEGPEIILTCGSTDGFAKSIEALTNIWTEGHMLRSDREGVFVEEFSYMTAIETVLPRGLNIVPVALDAEGMRPKGKGGLRDVLENWDQSRGKVPHLLYTVTIGQNPTSGILGVERRKEIYALCAKYDIIIIEDDPYWYLQYTSSKLSPSANSNVQIHPGISAGLKYNSPKSSGFPFLDSLIPSYLSFDTDGRVIRLDTFSKTVSPGCRLGWITAQPAICERLLCITETTTQQPSGFVQSLIAELLIGPQTPNEGGRGGSKDGSGWKVDGWVRWLEGLRGNYERRMVSMCKILAEGKYAVKSGTRGSIDKEWSVIEKVLMFDFEWPRGGMFVWVRLNLSTHPLYHRVSHEKLGHATWIHLTKKPFLVLAAPGSVFGATEEIKAERGGNYLRLCFAGIDEDEIEAASQAFVAGLRNFWTKKRVEDLDDIVKEEVVEWSV